LALECGRTTRYRLGCVGVTALGYVDPSEDPEAWPYVEITSAELRQRDDGRLEVAMCLWGDERELTIRCKDAKLEIDDSA
jgi:hypothetical protein